MECLFLASSPAVTVAYSRPHKSASPAAGDRLERLQELVSHAAHLLPAQGPITQFVHHNTLHALEELPFEKAVLKGAETFGCHPYLTESDYRAQFAKGRIRSEDLATVLIDDLKDDGDELLSYLGTRYQLRLAMLKYPLYSGPTGELRWFIAETEALSKFRDEVPVQVRTEMLEETRHWVMRDLRNGHPVPDGDERAKELVNELLQQSDSGHIEQWDNARWTSFTLQLLWLTSRECVARANIPPRSSKAHVRLRDSLLHVTGQDADQLVNDLLIRFCAAFLDQGFARWEMPNRSAGLFADFDTLYGRAWGPPDAWLRGLRQELKRIRDAKMTPQESIVESLQLLGVPQKNEEQFIGQTLLALRGYAGMIWQMESRGDHAGYPIPAGSLVEYLAVRLILDRLAAKHIAKDSLGYKGDLADLPEELARRAPKREPSGHEQRAFLVFQLAQLLGWSPKSLLRLSDDDCSDLFSELDRFSGNERRRIFHLAFERRYRTQTLDAVLAHRKRQAQLRVPGSEEENARPVFQFATCIDEREESVRRHMEEIEPNCQTLGVAGFFAVAIYYRGAADAHFAPLCPVIVTPQHYVEESVAAPHVRTDERRRNHRRTIGTVTHRVHIGSRTFAGGWLAALFGSLASLPLVMRILFPRATAQLRRVLGSAVRTPAVTQLKLERREDPPGPTDDHIGYSPAEMAGIVERLLRDMGLTSNFARLIVISGHGSSSMNNPHESAHDCGACGGGRGGPNARAFAQMANDPRIRRALNAKGLAIPDETVFIGCYHNTCDDSVTYYDLERLPQTHADDFAHVRSVINQARVRDAHERCRRFESAELSLTPEAALRHVEGRSEDLSQVRPEYGHATNALCFVGKRDWSQGLFLDRRAFLQSYDPAQDDENCSILERILQAVIPVCAGINLEYYFSFVDPIGYGCGTKLPHNITSLLGVMDGAASDLRTGLPWQMVEIHEPTRLLFVIETTPAAMTRIMESNPGINRLVRGMWVQLATLDPNSGELHLFQNGTFAPYHPEAEDIPVAASSIDWYRGWRDHLGFASVGPDYKQLAGK